MSSEQIAQDIADSYDNLFLQEVGRLTFLLHQINAGDGFDWEGIHNQVRHLQDIIDLRERGRHRNEGSHLHLTQTSFADIQE